MSKISVLSRAADGKGLVDFFTNSLLVLASDAAAAGGVSVRVSSDTKTRPCSWTQHSTSCHLSIISTKCFRDTLIIIIIITIIIEGHL